MLCCAFDLLRDNLLVSLRVTSLVLGQTYDFPSASEITLKNMGIRCYSYAKIWYHTLHNDNKTKYNKTMSIFYGIYCKIIGLPYLQGGFLYSYIILCVWLTSSLQLQVVWVSTVVSAGNPVTFSYSLYGNIDYFQRTILYLINQDKTSGF